MARLLGHLIAAAALTSLAACGAVSAAGTVVETATDVVVAPVKWAVDDD